MGTASPTDSPTTSPPTATPEGCFSNNYKTCLPDGYTSDSTLCNKTWLPRGAQKNCVACGASVPVIRIVVAVLRSAMVIATTQLVCQTPPSPHPHLPLNPVLPVIINQRKKWKRKDRTVTISPV